MRSRAGSTRTPSPGQQQHHAADPRHNRPAIERVEVEVGAKCADGHTDCDQAQAACDVPNAGPPSWKPIAPCPKKEHRERRHEEPVRIVRLIVPRMDQISKSGPVSPDERCRQNRAAVKRTPSALAETIFSFPACISSVHLRGKLAIDRSSEPLAQTPSPWVAPGKALPTATSLCRSSLNACPGFSLLKPTSIQKTFS